MKFRKIFTIFSRRTLADRPPPLSPTELYIAGGGDLETASPDTLAVLSGAEEIHRERSQPSDPLHAHEVTTADATLIRVMAGAMFGPDSTVTLPSGRTITGREMQQWVNATNRQIAMNNRKR